MQTGALVMMMLGCCVIWGGLLVCVIIALKKQ